MNTRRTLIALPALLASLALVALGGGCKTDVRSSGGAGGAGSTTSASTASATTSDASSSTGPPPQCPAPDTDLPMEDLGTGADPEQGMFTLDEALAGLPEGPGPLRAIFDTEEGAITCELLPGSAPNGVANFVGLARGRRPFKKSGHWLKGTRYYDGLIFHRVIDNFVAQGGDPLGTGTGGPGYKFKDEIDPTKSHVPGALAYANSGPNTNGSQFYMVAEVAQTGLDGDYVIFGQCADVPVIQAITEVETSATDKPLVPVHMTTVTITRCAP